MVKAKEWAQRFLNLDDALASREGMLKKVFQDYIDETVLLINKRGSAIEGAIREQEIKFRAIGQYVPGVDWSDFEQILWEMFQEEMPEVSKAYVEESNKRRRRLFERNLRQESQIEREKIDKIEDPGLRLGMLIAMITDRDLRRKEFI